MAAGGGASSVSGKRLGDGLGCNIVPACAIAEADVMCSDVSSTYYGVGRGVAIGATKIVEAGPLDGICPSRCGRLMIKMNNRSMRLSCWLELAGARL